VNQAKPGRCKNPLGAAIKKICRAIWAETNMIFGGPSRSRAKALKYLR